MHTCRLAGVYSGNQLSGWQSAPDLDELPARQLRGAFNCNLHAESRWEPCAGLYNSCPDQGGHVQRVQFPCIF